MTISAQSFNGHATVEVHVSAFTGFTPGLLSCGVNNAAMSDSDGREISFDSLYQEHANAVYRFAFFLTKDGQLAQDITSDTFLRAWTRHSDIRQLTVRSYLFTIAKNLYRDHLRRAKRDVALETDFLDESPNATALLENAQTRLALQELLAGIPELDREIIILRYQENMPYEEIASALNVNVGAVRVRAHRARQKLLRGFVESGRTAL